MEQAARKRKASATAQPELEKLHLDLLALYDDLTETSAWSALVCDGVCAILADHPAPPDSSTQTGMRFAAIWLKQRHQQHANRLQAVCNRLRKIRSFRR